MKKTPLLEALSSRVLVCDGGMGTELIALGLDSGACGMLWNAERPDDVLSVHRAYRDAGCDLVTSNSFGGNRPMLDRHHAGGRLAELNRLAAATAARAAGDEAWVLGDVGPFGDFLEPMGDTTEDELLAIFIEQMSALRDGGADAFLVETMADPGEVAVAIRAARAVAPHLPVIATYTFQKTAGVFRTLMGTTAAQAVAAALEAGADIVGTNCGTDLDLDDYVALARELVAAAGNTPVIVQPNAGAPKSGPDGFSYDATPAEMAACARRLVDAGVRIVGGCCGTNPSHLRAIAAELHASHA